MVDLKSRWSPRTTRWSKVPAEASREAEKSKVVIEDLPTTHILYCQTASMTPNLLETNSSLRESTSSC